ncbi:MAG: beta-L-arabinofuranosidase domain-containing protein [Pirellulales bacterium]
MNLRAVSVVSAILIIQLASRLACAADIDPAEYFNATVPSKQVRVTGGLWGQRIAANRNVTIPHLFRMNDENERLNNLRKGAGLLDGPYISRRYNDTDVYKLLEAVGYDLMLQPNYTFESIADEQIEIIQKAQRPSGYLFPALTVDPARPAPGVGPGPWDSLGGSHELYNHGHMIEAAVAYFEATGKEPFLEVAIKAGDLLCETFGADKRRATSGHEEIEIALAKLHRVTGEKKYLDLLKFFIDQRGKEHQITPHPPGPFAMYNDRWYRQDDKPVVQQTAGQGHAVRATYLYCGLTDLAALTGEKPYIEATDRIWQSVVGGQMYIMGGVGSTGGTEAFADPYVLPNSPSYCESCAAIGNALWNERMFRLHGDAKYIDVMERIVMNGVLTGISTKGDRFFYQNPQEQLGGRGGRGRRGGGQRRGDGQRRSDGQRRGDATGGDTGLGGGAFEGGEQAGARRGNRGGGGANEGPRRAWFDVACCPANLSRFVAQFPGYIYSKRDGALCVNFFVPSEAEITFTGRTVVRVKQETNYPWDGDVKITVNPVTPGEFTVKVRIPGWAQGHALPSDLYVYEPVPKDRVPEPLKLKVNGAEVEARPENGYAVLKREWKAGDTIDLHLPMPPRRTHAHEDVAADRGKVALERGPLVYCFEGADNGDRVATLYLPDDVPLEIEKRTDERLGEITVIRGKVGDNELTAIPYQLWGNRGTTPMRIWVPREAPVAADQGRGR